MAKWFSEILASKMSKNKREGAWNLRGWIYWRVGVLSTRGQDREHGWPVSWEGAGREGGTIQMGGPDLIANLVLEHAAEL